MAWQGVVGQGRAGGPRIEVCFALHGIIGVDVCIREWRDGPVRCVTMRLCPWFWVSGFEVWIWTLSSYYSEGISRSGVHHLCQAKLWSVRCSLLLFKMSYYLVDMWLH